MTSSETTKRKKKRKKKTTGISRRSLLLGFSPVLLAQDSAAYALIAGTVFRESGHAFSGVNVELVPANPDKKFKKQRLATTPRGEFAFRVPASPMEYTLSLRPDGYRADSKHVKIVGDERVDISFLLERAR